MDPLIMKTVGEEWARDRQQRRQEREMEHQHAEEPRHTRPSGRHLWARLSVPVRSWRWIQRRPQPGDGRTG